MPGTRWSENDKFLFADRNFEYFVHFTPKNAEFYYVHKASKVGETLSPDQIIGAFKTAFYEMNQALADAFREANQKSNFPVFAQTVDLLLEETGVEGEVL